MTRVGQLSAKVLQQPLQDLKYVILFLVIESGFLEHLKNKRGRFGDSVLTIQLEAI